MTWPASRADAQELQDALGKLVTNSGAIENLYERAGDHLAALNTNQGADLIWGEALRNLAASGRLKAFFEVLRTRGPQADAFKKKVDAVFDATAEFEQPVLSSGVLVIDRTALRAQIALLVARDSPASVLLVRGAPKSGKTHGYYLFEAAAKEAGAEAVYIG